MGREPVLLTRRKDFRFAIVRLLERYQVEAQVLCISELARNCCGSNCLY